ncbi:hypothetical protein DWG18_10605 [Lysobacter sp. TY2-98]|nr:hypothetical protein DWG18_10605 [Lysobacter sp. TY2-98]
MRGALVCVAMSIASFGSVVHAQSPDDDPYAAKKFACPIGGQVFEQSINYPALALVQFPDGSWLGDHLIDAQLPECPKDGLVLIPDFETHTDAGDLLYPAYTPEQVAKLATLVKTDEFRALRKRGRYERAEWIARQLDMPAYTRLQTLMRASWATVKPVDRKRLVARLAAEGPQLIAATTRPELEKLALRVRVANALRELGRFEEADAELAAIGTAIPEDADVTDRDLANDVASTIASMHEVVGFHDDDRFPVDLASSRWASQMCSGQDMPAPYGPMTANARAACKRREAHRQEAATTSATVDQLLRDPKALDQRCAATPENEREPGLAQACRFQDMQRGKDEGEELLMQHPAQVAAQCEPTAQRGEPNGPMWHACIGYRSYLESALRRLLVEDDAGYAIVCSNGRQPPDRAAYASVACGGAEQDRITRGAARWMLDPTALDAACAATPMKDRDPALYMACSQRADDLKRLAAERLAADPAAYRAQCAAFDARGESRWDTGVTDENWQCDKARSIRERTQRQEAPPPALAALRSGISSAESEVSKVAMDYAKKIVAKAKTENTYPRRKRGDLY